MNPETIENWRKIFADRYAGASKETNELCELALDGLRFRAWIEGASFRTGDPGMIAKALAKTETPNDYRRAIDEYIVHRVKRRSK